MSETDDKKSSKLNSADAATAPAPDETPKTDLDVALEESAKWKKEFLYLKAEFEKVIL